MSPPTMLRGNRCVALLFLAHSCSFNVASSFQRYFLRDSFYKPGGPVFLMIGGEGAISSKWMHEGMWIRYAQENNALCLQLEHRYYGKSHPTTATSTEELKYLSSEQALADLGNFIVSMNAEHNLTGKWISFGGSYPGSLSAWLREKYPHLVHGSISSSGPLLAKVDFQEYFDVVVASLTTHSDSCSRPFDVVSSKLNCCFVTHWANAASRTSSSCATLSIS